MLTTEATLPRHSGTIGRGTCQLRPNRECDRCDIARPHSTWFTSSPPSPPLPSTTRHTCSQSSKQKQRGRPSRYEISPSLPRLTPSHPFSPLIHPFSPPYSTSLHPPRSDFALHAPPGEIILIIESHHGAPHANLQRSTPSHQISPI